MYLFRRNSYVAFFTTSSFAGTTRSYSSSVVLARQVLPLCAPSSSFHGYAHATVKLTIRSEHTMIIYMIRARCILVTNTILHLSVARRSPFFAFRPTRPTPNQSQIALDLYIACVNLDLPLLLDNCYHKLEYECTDNRRIEAAGEETRTNNIASLSPLVSFEFGSFDSLD